MTNTPDQFINGYGPAYTPGVLSEHVTAFCEVGGVIRPAASGSGRTWAVVNGRAVPVVCSELVPWATEDEPTVIRCGVPAVDGYCESHGAEVAEWRGASEAELIAWERARS